MARRISDVVETRVRDAIEGLDVLQPVRDSIEWDISPALIPQGREMALAYMVAISIRVPGTVEDDYFLHMRPLLDPHADQPVFNVLVAELYELCQAQADETRARLNAQSNGHRQSPGGLIIGGLSTP